jgi:hypothetical protein
MRRHLLTLALVGAFGALLLSNDAQACCHKKRCPQPTCCVVPPPPPPPPVCEPAPCPPAKKCGLFHRGGCGHARPRLGFCHKKAACAPPCAVAPVYYAAPTPQAYYPSAQG